MPTTGVQIRIYKAQERDMMFVCCCCCQPPTTYTNNNMCGGGSKVEDGKLIGCSMGRCNCKDDVENKFPIFKLVEKFLLLIYFTKE